MPDGQREWEEDRSREEGLNRHNGQPSSFNGVTFPVSTQACASTSGLPVAVFPFLNFNNADDEAEYEANI